MSDASEVIWQVADETETAPTTLDAIPASTRDYIAAWMETVHHGCGHPAVVHYTSMPMRSVVCPSCADRLGLADRARRCGVCSANLGDDGTVTVFAVDEHLIVFASICAGCLARAKR